MTPRLLLQAEQLLSRPVHPHLLAYCPTMDMLALVTQEEELEVYRLNGQRAFNRKRRADAKIDSICWKFNGKSIVVAWDDLTVEIISTETGKPVVWERHQELQDDEDESDERRIRCLAWSFNFIDVPSIKARVGDAPKTASLDSNGTTDDWDVSWNGVTLNDVLQGMNDLKVLDAIPDLPGQIASMDPERLLPKISPIPLAPAGPLGRPVQATPDVFTSQTSIDAMFHSQHLEFNNAVETLLLCHANGEVSPTMYTSLELAPTKLPDGWSLKPGSPILHSTHPYSRSHSLLTDIVSTAALGPPGQSKLALVPLTFRFMSSSGFRVHLVGAKQQQLSNLLRYIQESIRSISAYWSHAQDLPGRFMRNINETLSEKGEGDLATNLYHLAATGHCPATIKEWLVDELAEMGHKRWDHAGTLGYTKVVELVHENFLPALDRCSIIVTSLRGLAQYDDSGTLFDVPVKSFTVILDILRCLRLLGHYILQYAAEERRQFLIFSKWLRHEIDVQATDPASTSAEEMLEKDPNVNYAQLLAYIEGGLSESHLVPFIKRTLSLSEEARQRTVEPYTYEDVSKALERYKNGSLAQKDILDIWTMFIQLQLKSRDVFSRIARWQASNTTMSTGLVLEEDEIAEARDVRMMFENLAKPESLTTYVAAVPKSNSTEVRLHRIVHDDTIDNINTAVSSSSVLSIALPTGGTIADVKFVDDEKVLVLWKPTTTPQSASSSPTSDADLFSEAAGILLSLPYNGNKDSRQATRPAIPYRSRVTRAGTSAENIAAMALPSGYAGGPRPVWDLSEPEAPELRKYIRHVFTAKDRFVPVKLEVNGRQHRRVVVVLGESSKAYKILDLDFNEGEEAKKEEGERY